MTAAKRAKEIGAKSLTEIANAINKKDASILNRWYHKNRALFEIVVFGYVMMQEGGITVAELIRILDEYNKITRKSRGELK